MLVCPNCRVIMRCKKNSVVCTWGELCNHRRQGDLFKCPGCESEVVLANDMAYDSTGPLGVDDQFHYEMERE